MKATDIFTPGTLPQYTYYDRDELKLEWRLLEAIETKGFISSVSGPSKSGKTVLCETGIGKRRMLMVTGGGVSTEDHFWRKLRQRLSLPAATTSSSTRGGTAEFGGKAGASVQLPLIAGGKAELEGKAGTASSSGEAHEYDGPDGTELLEYVAAHGYTLVVDDFHYVDRLVQKSLAEPVSYTHLTLPTIYSV